MRLAGEALAFQSGSTFLLGPAAVDLDDIGVDVLIADAVQFLF